MQNWLSVNSCLAVWVLAVGCSSSRPESVRDFLDSDASSCAEITSSHGRGMAQDSASGDTRRLTKVADRDIGMAVRAKPWVLLGDGSCNAPILLRPPVALRSETTFNSPNHASALHASCLGMDTAGPDRIYKVRVPAAGSTRLNVRVVPNRHARKDDFDPVVYLISSCDLAAPHPRCFSCQDNRGPGQPETLEYENESGALQDLLIVVDGFDDQPHGGDFQIEVALTSS